MWLDFGLRRRKLELCSPWKSLYWIAIARDRYPIEAIKTFTRSVKVFICALSVHCGFTEGVQDGLLKLIMFRTLHQFVLSTDCATHSRNSWNACQPTDWRVFYSICTLEFCTLYTSRNADTLVTHSRVSWLGGCLYFRGYLIFVRYIWDRKQRPHYSEGLYFSTCPHGGVTVYIPIQC